MVSKPEDCGFSADMLPVMFCRKSYLAPISLAAVHEKLIISTKNVVQLFTRVVLIHELCNQKYVSGKRLDKRAEYRLFLDTASPSLSVLLYAVSEGTAALELEAVGSIASHDGRDVWYDRCLSDMSSVGG